MRRNLKSKSLVLSLAILLTSCSASIINLDSSKFSVITDSSKKVVSTLLTKEEIAERDKEYSFSTKALSIEYFKRKLQELIGSDSGSANGLKIVKELEYARIKGESKIPTQAMFNADSTFYNTVILVSAVQNARQPSGIPFDVFLGGTVNPFPALPSDLSNTSISSSGFTANWGSVSGATSYDIILDTGSEINILSPTITYNFTGLSEGNHTWKVRANNVNGSSSYTSEQSVLIPSTFQGLISTIIGNGSNSYSGDNGLAVNATLSYSANVTTDSSGNVYFSADNRIRKINTSTGIVTTIAGTGTATYSGDGGQATLASLNSPNGLTIDNSTNTLYFCDSGNNRIRKINLSTGDINLVAGTSTTGDAPNGSIALSSSLNNPYSIQYNNGFIYFNEQQNLKVKKINLSTGIITTIAGTGVQGYSGDGDQATSAQINFVYGLVSDNSGNVYISDTSNFRIRKIDTNGIITTIAGTGGGSYAGDGGLATLAEINRPAGITFDDNGNLIFGAMYNHALRKINMSTGIITTIAGTGTSGYNGEGTATTKQLRYPIGVAYFNGIFYVSDSENYRIRKVY